MHIILLYQRGGGGADGIHAAGAGGGSVDCLFQQHEFASFNPSRSDIEKKVGHMWPNFPPIFLHEEVGHMRPHFMTNSVIL